MIRVLVVEDSASVRELLVRLLQSDGRFEVVGMARDGKEAVLLAGRLRPDVITMDVHLPHLDGVEATRRIMAETPTPIVVVTSSVQRNGTGAAFEALRAGAVTVLEKPPGPDHRGHAAATQELLTTVRLMAEMKVVRRRVVPRAARLAATPPVLTDRVEFNREQRPLAIAIAASTGGPQAIQTVLQTLGRDVEVPVLAVQHMSRGFLNGMIDWLAATCPQPVQLAAHGEEPRSGVVYIAPDEYHLLITRRGTLALSKAPPVGGFRPSANLLFESVAERYGARAVGIILTGMGSDGSSGLSVLRAAGALTIAQDATSSVVYGMPRAAAASGAAARVLPLAAIGPMLRRLLARSTTPDYHAEVRGETR